MAAKWSNCLEPVLLANMRATTVVSPRLDHSHTVYFSHPLRCVTDNGNFMNCRQISCTDRIDQLLRVLLATITAALVGCQARDSQYQSVAPSQATAQLKELLPGLSDQANLIRSGSHVESGSQYWVLVSPKRPIKPPTSLKAVGPSECPASAIFSYAQASGARDVATGQPFQLGSQTTSGQLWQWQSGQANVRWRSASTVAGEQLIVIELITKDP
jgi:hypothetical protein